MEGEAKQIRIGQAQIEKKCCGGHLSLFGGEHDTGKNVQIFGLLSKRLPSTDRINQIYTISGLLYNYHKSGRWFAIIKS